MSAGVRGPHVAEAPRDYGGASRHWPAATLSSAPHLLASSDVGGQGCVPL